jgi:gas vesicle protein
MNVSALYQLFSTLIGSSLGAGIVTQLLTTRSQRSLQSRQQRFEEQARREREEHERSLQQERVVFEDKIARAQQQFEARLQHSLEQFKSDYGGLRSRRLDAYMEVYSALSDLLDAAGNALARIHSIPADKPAPAYYQELLAAWDNAFQRARNVFNRTAIFISDESETVLAEYISLHSEKASDFYVTVVGPLSDGEGVKATDWGKVSAAMKETLKPSLEKVLKHLKAEIEPKIREILEEAKEVPVDNQSGV